MPSLIGSLFVSLTADFAPFQRNMQQAESVTASTSSGIRRSMGLTEKSVTSLQRSMSSGIKPYALISASKTFDTVQQRANLLRGALFATTAAFGGLGAALTSNVVSRYLDTFQNLSNQIRVVASGSADLASQIQAVANVAERSRSSLSAVGLLYARLSKAAPDDGSEKLLRRVETINKALQLGGATSEEAASAAIQFSQAIQSNKLGGDELRAVLETPLGGELAKGLGVTIGQMRKMSIQGKLTADVVFAALDKISGSVDQKFAKSILTIDQALTIADNKLVLYAGSVNDAYGVTKLITGAIGAFGNNLDTIIPLVAKLGAGLGIVFAGRTAASLGEATFGKVAKGIQEVTAARKEDVRLAAEQVAATNAAQTAARSAVETAKSVQQTAPESLAPKTNVKQYQRDSAALQAADLKHLELLQKKAVVTTQLGEIYKTTTVGEIKAAQALAGAQEKVNDTLNRQRVARRTVNVAENGVTGAAALQSQATGKLSQTTAAQKELNAAKAAQVAIDKEVAAADAALGNTQQAILKETNASYLAAAEQRAAVLVAEKRLNQELQASEQSRAQLAATARVSKGNLVAAGATAAQEGVNDASAILSRTQEASQRAATALSIASKEAGLLSTGLSLVKGAGASLVGFLGGPWGVAFTAAIGIMAYLGITSQKTAETMARAQGIIDEALPKNAAGGDSNAALELAQGRALALAKQIDDLNFAYKANNDALRNNLNYLAEDTKNRTNSIEATKAQYAAIDDLITRLGKGKVSATDFRSEFDKISGGNPVFDQLRQDAEKLAVQMINNRTVAAQLGAELDALNGKTANLQVNVNVNDPLGILTRGLSSAAASAAQSGGNDAAETGRNQAILTKIQQTKTAKDNAAELKRAAGDRGQKIEDKAQELFTADNGNSGRTLAESRALAARIIQLQETSKASKSAAKDYENFAHKLAELKAGSLGAGLGEIDNKVITFAKSLKDGSKMITQYIDAVKSGDLGKAPKQLQEARAAFVQIAADDSAKEIVQKYGTAGQLAAQFAEKQEILNKAVADGSITAAQAATAYADFLGQFGNYDWIDKISSSITNFAETAIFDFKNIGDAAKSLVQDIEKIIIQATLLQPLQNTLNGIFGSFVGGGAGGAGAGIGTIADLLAPGSFEFHEGSLSVGSNGGKARPMPAGAFAGAPRYHNGLNANEMTAILQKGEGVLKQRDMKRTIGLIGGMSGSLREGGGQPIIQIIDNAGVKKRTEPNQGPNGDITKIILDTVEGGVSSGRLDNAFGGRFGASAKTTRR